MTNRKSALLPRPRADRIGRRDLIGLFCAVSVKDVDRAPGIRGQPGSAHGKTCPCDRQNCCMLRTGKNMLPARQSDSGLVASFQPSKGLGAATARLFTETGARVVITFSNDANAAERLIATLPGAGHRASRTPAQDTAAIESLAAEIGATEGRLDILVNNAGSTRVIPHADLRALDYDFFNFVLAANLRGPFATVRACRHTPRCERTRPRRQCRFGIRCARRRQQYRLCRGQSRAARDDDVRCRSLRRTDQIERAPTQRTGGPRRFDVAKRELTRPTDATIKRLFARSGNRCAFPKCPVEIVQGDTLVGEMCHIRAARPGGPRYDPNQTAAERHGYDNLTSCCAAPITRSSMMTRRPTQSSASSK